jgi:hypothetical protein
MEEKIIVYIKSDEERTALIERLARWMTVSALGPRTYALSSARENGYLYVDEAQRTVTLQFEALEQATEIGSLARLFWMLSLCDDLVQRGIASAIVVGAKDDIDPTDVAEQARHAAAWFPDTLLGEEKGAYLKLGSFRISPYALDHLTAFMTPPGAATESDRATITAINAFLDRQRDDSTRRSDRAASIAGEAMRRLREPPDRGDDESDPNLR